MQNISFIFEQNIHIPFLQYLFVCLLNLYFFSKLSNKKFIFASILMACIMSILYLWINFYTTILLWILLMLLNQKVFKSNTVECILNATLSVFLLIFSDYIVEFFLQTIFTSYTLSLNLRVAVVDLILGIILAILMKKFLDRLTATASYEIFKQILCAFLLFTVGIYYVLITINRFFTQISIDFQAHVFLLLFYSCLSIFLCSIAFVTMLKQMNLKMKKREMEQIIDYTNQLEQSYMEMRKFKHDYKNILTSIEIFIAEGDMEKLADYYKTYIRPTKNAIETNFSRLSDLNQIKVSEIKSIFSSKLLRAQAMGMDTTFECQTEITKFYMDSLTLVRSLGILLDNAIEEVESNFNKGKIEVACIQQEHSIQIIVRNSCKENMPQVYQMKAEGFSTKGENRGLGLSNLEEMLSTLKHVTLDTQCINGQFTQIIEIAKEEKYATNTHL